MASDLKSFYNAHWRLCVAFKSMVDRRIMMIGRQEGYTNREFPESVLRDALASICEELRRDMAQQGIIMPDWLYDLLREWTFEECFGGKKQWIVGK